MYFRELKFRRVLFAVGCCTFFLINCGLYFYEDRLSNHPEQESRSLSPKVTTRIMSTAPPGHMGAAVRIISSDLTIASEINRTMVEFGLNEYASDMVSVQRQLPDLRDHQCHSAAMNYKLPDPAATSIVIVFYNEPWSVLVRTVHSVLDRSPSQLLREIILVDDCSSYPYLKTQLEEYFEPYSKVRIIRAKTRLGLIRARILGAKSASSDILTFLDAHVECTAGWLEPLLDVVARNSSTVAVPTIDRIDEKDLRYETNVSLLLAGAFEWDLNFGWCQRSQLRRKYAHSFEPFHTPAMAGGLFTIDRKFFDRIGWYDEGYIVYGMENAELSIKVWMCGGALLTVPCSRVGHIQKHAHPYLFNVKKDVALYNSVRLAEVWMDEYKQVVFDVNGIPHFSQERFGSVDDRKRVRTRAQCGSFQDYLRYGFPEITSPAIEGQFRGEVRNVALRNESCLTVDEQRNVPYMAECDGLEQTQYWSHSFYQDINSYKRCLDFTGVQLLTAICHRHRRNQAWMYVSETGQIFSSTHYKCLAVDKRSNVTLTMEKCEATEPRQQWNVQLVQYDFLKNS